MNNNFELLIEKHISSIKNSWWTFSDLFYAITLIFTVIFLLYFSNPVFKALFGFFALNNAGVLLYRRGLYYGFERGFEEGFSEGLDSKYNDYEDVEE